MRSTLGVLAMILLGGCAQQASVKAPPDVSIEVGKPFPNLVLPALADGKPSSIAQFQGKKVLLHVFASW